MPSQLQELQFMSVWCVFCVTYFLVVYWMGEARERGRGGERVRVCVDQRLTVNVSCLLLSLPPLFLKMGFSHEPAASRLC